MEEKKSANNGANDQAKIIKQLNRQRNTQQLRDSAKRDADFAVEQLQKAADISLNEGRQFRQSAVNEYLSAAKKISKLKDDDDLRLCILYLHSAVLNSKQLADYSHFVFKLQREEKYAHARGSADKQVTSNNVVNEAFKNLHWYMEYVDLDEEIYCKSVIEHYPKIITAHQKLKDKTEKDYQNIAIIYRDLALAYCGLSGIQKGKVDLLKEAAYYTVLMRLVLDANKISNEKLAFFSDYLDLLKKIIEDFELLGGKIEQLKGTVQQYLRHTEKCAAKNENSGAAVNLVSFSALNNNKGKDADKQSSPDLSSPS